MPSSRRLTVIAPFATVPLCVFLLAGCGFLEPTTTATPSVPAGSPSATSAPDPGTTSTPAPEPGVPIGIDCDALVTAQAMYDFNPNFALQSDFAPTAGSPGAEAVADSGIACSWVNLTSGQTIEISAAQPGPSELEARRSEVAASSNSVPTYIVEGFFILADGIGRADAFDGPYWVTMTSELFFEPGDVAPLMAAAVGALG